MTDLQIYKVVDLLPHEVLSDSLEAGVRTVGLRLRNLAAYVAEVSVNGYQSASFTSTGSHTIEVVPHSLLNLEDINDLTFLVLSSEYSDGALEHEILFDIGRHSRTVSGNSYLLQKWIRFMLMSPGSDKKDLSAGCGLLQFSGSVTSGNLSDVRVFIARMHHNCKSQIVARQLRTSAKPSETLRDARLLSVTLDENNQLVVRSLLVDGNNRTLAADVRV